MSEAKIVYLDNGSERCIRGTIVAEDDFFVTLKRRDGIIRIGKRAIIKIESWRGGNHAE